MLSGKVALITGAEGGSGSAQAIRLAREGADIALFTYADAAVDVVAQIKELGRNVTSHQVDTRDLFAMQSAVDDAVAVHGRLDIVCATAGKNGGNAPLWELTPETFARVFDTNVYGTWHTIRATVPHVLASDSGGSIIVMGSTVQERAAATAGHYVASKYAVWGLTATLAAELGPHGVRVNAIVPTNIDTPMFHNPETYALLLPGIDNPDRGTVNAAAAGWHTLPIGWVGTDDVAAATAFLAGTESRYITGTALRVDAGLLSKWPG
jgi:NAD(P)-dependent dehydrogenase (short-subunit alcohol dehydrogenase family)